VGAAHETPNLPTSRRRYGHAVGSPAPRSGARLSDAAGGLIVGVAAGGAADNLARQMGQWLSERLGQAFIIENRPGAGSNTATEAVVRAAPDGNTLVLAGPASAINATLYENLNFNFIRDILPKVYQWARVVALLC
jgi:tripartite-type tricarboxylate transporter receptor subunit TctC